MAEVCSNLLLVVNFVFIECFDLKKFVVIFAIHTNLSRLNMSATISLVVNLMDPAQPGRRFSRYNFCPVTDSCFQNPVVFDIVIVYISCTEIQICSF